MTALIQILDARLGKDPDTKMTDSGKAVTRFSVASNTGYGENRSTTWYDCVLFDKAAETAAKYLRKGSLVALAGEHEIRRYTAKDGTERQQNQVTVRHFTLPPKSDTASAPQGAPASDPWNDNEPPPF